MPVRPLRLLLLAIIMLTAIWVRWEQPRKVVLTPSRTFLLENDSYYHARVADVMTKRWPRMVVWDAWLAADAPHPATVAPLFPFLAATTALVMSGGSPDQPLVDRVLAWLPVALAALTVIPVWLIARKLWGEIAGLAAAGAIALMPGEYLKRSLLGYADQHVAEVLLSTVVFLFAIQAVSADATGDGSRDIRPPDRRPLPKPWSFAAPQWRLFALFCGFAMAAYLLTWRSAGMILLLVFAWALAAPFVVVGEQRALKTTAVAFGVAAAVMTASLIWIPLLARQHLALAGAACAVLVAAIAVERWARARSWRRLILLAMLASVTVIAGGLAELLLPGSVSARLGDLRRFRPGDEALLINEVRPLLSPGAGVTPLFEQFGMFLWPAAAGAVLLAWRLIRERDSGHLLLAIWSAGALLATLGQSRFAYYMAVNVALLSGLTVGWIARPTLTRGRGRHQTRSVQRIPLRPLFAAGLAALLFATAVAPARTVAASLTPRPAVWFEAFDALRAGTPAPFASEGAYEEIARRRADASRPGYGVIAWWDHGYAIAREARRVPTANPTQHGARPTAAFFLAQDADEVRERAGALRARYVVADWRLVALAPDGESGDTGQLPAIALWGGERSERYCETYIATDAAGRTEEYLLFYPDYFRTAAVRLALFGGDATVATNIEVVTYREIVREGRTRKSIVSVERFPSESEAERFAASPPSGTWRRVVSTNPQESCVTLPPIDSVRSVWRSPRALSLGPSRRIPAITIYEVIE